MTAKTTEEPKFTPPNIAKILEDRIAEDPSAARIRWGMEKNPDSKWFPKVAEAVKAAQREIDDWVEGEAIESFLRKHLKNAATAEVGLDLIDSLRSRVRVPEGAPLREIILAVLQGKWARSTIMLCPLNKPIEPWVHWAHLALIKRMPWLGYDQVEFPSLTYARNKLVDSFLRTEAEWSFWLDGDTVCPMGDSSAFYHRFGANPGFVKPEWLNVQAIDKLASRGKTLISGVVADRHPGNRFVIQPELNPQKDEDHQLVKQLKKDGPQDKVIQVPYVGTGCLLVHRSVYEEIKKRHPERGAITAGEPFNFFGGGAGMDAQGEDIAFCKLATSCGHPAFLDLSVWCAHVGTHSYFPQPQF